MEPLSEWQTGSSLYRCAVKLNCSARILREMRVVLLVVDNPHREMRGMMAIWLRLWRKNIAAHIVSKTTFNDWFEILHPDVIVVPRITGEFARFLKTVADRTKIVVIPSEHGNGFEQKVLNNMFGQNFALKRERSNMPELAALILVGGQNQRDWIANADSSLGPCLRVVGTLNSDHWVKPKAESQSSQVGICTTFKSLMMSTSNNSIHWLWYSHLRPAYRDNAWRLAIQNFELHYLATVFEAVDTMVESGYTVDVRPHPHEYWPGWKRWRKKMSPTVSVNRQVDLSGWIDSKFACLTSFSTTSLDCIARGVPSISLENLVKDEVERVPAVKEPLKGEYSWQVSSMSELLELLQKARNGTLPCSPKLADAQEFMRLNFNFPRPSTCATLCVEAIEDLLSAPRQASAARSLRSFLKLPLSVAKIAAKDLRDFFGPRRSNLLFTLSIKMWLEAYRFNRDIVL